LFLLGLVHLEGAIAFLEESDDLLDGSAATVGVGLLGLSSRLDLAEGAALAELLDELSSSLGSDISSIAESAALLHLGHESSLVDNLSTGSVDENTVSSHLVKDSSVDAATSGVGQRGVDGDDVASAVKLLKGLASLDTGSLHNLSLDEGIEAVDLHAEALGDGGDSASDSTIGLKTELAATELVAALAGEATTDSHDGKTEGDLSNSVGVLAGGVHDNDALGGASGKVDGIVTGTSTDDDLQSRGVLKKSSVDLIGTDDQSLSLTELGIEVLLGGIALAEDELVVGLVGLEELLNLSDGVLGEGLLSSNNDGVHFFPLTTATSKSNKKQQQQKKLNEKKKNHNKKQDDENKSFFSEMYDMLKVFYYK